MFFSGLVLKCYGCVPDGNCSSEGHWCCLWSVFYATGTWQVVKKVLEMSPR